MAWEWNMEKKRRPTNYRNAYEFDDPVNDATTATLPGLDFEDPPQGE
jgi:hypothetical protein